MGFNIPPELKGRIAKWETEQRAGKTTKLDPPPGAETSGDTGVTDDALLGTKKRKSGKVRQGELTSPTSRPARPNPRRLGG